MFTFRTYWFIPIFFSLCFLTPAARAQYTFTASASGDWNAAGTWTRTGTGVGNPLYPGATTDPSIVVIPNPFNVTVPNGGGTGANSVGSLTVDQGGTLTLNVTNNNAASVVRVGGVTNINGAVTAVNVGGGNSFYLFSGLVTIGTTGSWSGAALTNAGALRFGGGLTINAGAGTAAFGVIRFTTSGQTVTVNRATTVAAAFATGDLPADGNTLTLAGTGTLTFSGNVSIRNGSTITNNITTGGVTINGTLNGGNATSTWTQGTNAILTYTSTASANAPMATGVLNAAGTGNTVLYNRADVQTIKAATYHHLTTGGTGVKTTGGVVGVNGNLTVATGTTFTVGNTAAWNLTVTGTTAINGTLNYSAAQVTSDFTGLVTVANGGTITATSQTTAGGFILRNGLNTQSGGTASLGAIRLPGTAQTLTADGTVTVAQAVAAADLPTTLNLTGTGNLTFVSTVTIPATSTIANQMQGSGSPVTGGLTITGTLNGTNAASTFAQGSNAQLVYNAAAAPMLTGTFTVNTIGNQVSYNGATAQAINRTSAYANLSLTPAAAQTRTVDGTLTVNETLTVSTNATLELGSFVAGSSFHTLTGSGTISFTATAPTVAFPSVTTNNFGIETGGTIAITGVGGTTYTLPNTYTSFRNLTLTAPSGTATWNTTSNISLTGNLSVTNGTVTASYPSVWSVFGGNAQVVSGTNAAVTFYDLSINKTTGTAIRNSTAQTHATGLPLTVTNNLAIQQGVLRIWNNNAATVDLTVGANLAISLDGGLDISGSNQILVRIGGNLTDDNTSLPNTARGLYLGAETIPGTSVGSGFYTNGTPTIELVGTADQFISGNAQGHRSRAFNFTGIVLPAVTIAGGSSRIVTVSGIARVRGNLTINSGTFRLSAQSFYFGDDDNGADTDASSDQIIVNSGATFDVQGGTSLYAFPANGNTATIQVNNGGNLRMVGSGTSPILFERDGGFGAVTNQYQASANGRARIVFNGGTAGTLAMYWVNLARLGFDGGGTANAGLDIQSGNVDATYNLSYCTFAGGNNVSLLRWENSFTGNINVLNVTFTSAYADAVVRTTGAGGGTVTFVSASGSAGSQNNELDSPDGGATTGFLRWSSPVAKTWTGATSTDWNLAANWTPVGAPVATDYVIIPTTASTRYPLLTSNVTVAEVSMTGVSTLGLATFTLDVTGNTAAGLAGNLLVTSTATSALNLGTSGTLRLNGSLSLPNNNSLNAGTGTTVEFYGDGARNFTNTSGNSTLTVYNLLLSKTGDASVTMGFENLLVVNNNFSLTSGRFILNTQNNGVTVGGNFNISAGAIFDPVAMPLTLASNSAAAKTIRTSGNTLFSLTLSGGTAATYTLQDDLTLSSTLSLTGSGYRLNSNGFGLNVQDVTVATGATLAVDAGTTMSIASGRTVSVAGTVRVVGSSSNIAVVSCQTTGGTYTFTVTGTIAARYYRFQQMNAAGINVNAGTVDATNNFSDGVFDFGTTSNTNGAPGAYLRLNPAPTANYIIENVAFENTGAATINATGVTAPRLANVSVRASGAASVTGQNANTYIIRNSSGALLGGLVGSDVEDDAPAFAATNGSIRWEDTALRFINNSGDFSWNNAANWNLSNGTPYGSIPTASDRVILSNKHISGAYTVVVNSAATCGSLEIRRNNEGTANAAGNITLSLAAGNLTVVNTLTNGNLNTVSVGASRNLSIGTISNNGTFTQDATSSVTYTSSGVLGLTSFKNLVIGASGTYGLSGNTTVDGSVSLNSGTLDATTNNYNLTVAGNWNRVAGTSYVMRTSSLTFNGAASSTVTGPAAGESFTRMIVNKSTPAATVTLGNDLYITGNLLFLAANRANISTGSLRVIVSPGGSISGANSNGFINGKLGYIFNSTASVSRRYFTGKGSTYLPFDLDIALSTATSTLLVGEQFNADAVTLGLTPPPTILKLSPTRYWQVELVSGSAVSAARITLPYIAADNVTPGNTALRLLKSQTTAWQDITRNTAATSGDAFSGTITSNNFTAFSYFTFGTTDNAATSLPVTYLYFSGRKREGGVLLNWATASETNNDYFRVLRSTDARSWEEIGVVDGAGNTVTRRDYSFWDTTAPASEFLYYQLRQVDFDGTTTNSSIIELANQDKPQMEVLVYPNPLNDNPSVLVKGDPQLPVRVLLISTSGAVLYSSPRLFLPQLAAALQSRLAGLATGMYILTIQSLEVSRVIKLVKP